MTENEQESTVLDPRVRRTRKWLQDALTTLLQEQEYADISITDITKQADLARVTFYQHFESKNELLLSIAADLFEQIYATFDIERFVEFVEEGKIELASEIVKRRNIAPEHVRLMRVALNEVGLQVTELMVDEFLMKSAERGALGEEPRRLVATYHVGGTMALLNHFFLEGKPLPPNGTGPVPLVFLRALVLEAVTNGLLLEATTQEKSTS